MLRLPAKLAHRHVGYSIERERLFARLDAENQRPLLWVDGPAGAGKTALVSSYLAKRKLPALWYRVDDADVDIPTAVSYLARGASAITRKRRCALPLLTPEYLSDLPSFMRRFFRLFFEALPERAVLVFDSMESAPGGALHELLRSAVAELQPGQRLVVTAREAPPGALAHLQAKGMMSTLGAEQLRLTVDEGMTIAASHDLASEETVRRLLGATDGWAAGFVVLLAQRAGAVGDAPAEQLGEELFPYYLHELFERVDPATQSLLMHTAVLPDFTEARAAALATDARTEFVLQWLLKHHFFIERSGGNAPVYRYHELFRAFLLKVGRERLTADRRHALLLQAGGLLQAEGQDEAAMALFIEAQAWSPAVRQLGELAPRLLNQGRSATLANLVAALPADAGSAGHWLHLWGGLARLQTAPAKARAELERAYADFAIHGEVSGQLRACAAIIESYFLEWGNMRPIDRWGDALHDLLRNRDVDLPEDVEVRALSRLSVLMIRGHRHAELVESGYRRALKLLAGLEEPVLRILLMNLIGLLHYFRGEWDAGRQFVADTGAMARADSAMPMQLVGWHVVRARLMVWSGDFVAADAVLVEAERLAAEHSIRGHVSLTASTGVFANVNAGDLAAAETWLARLRTGALPSRALDAVNLGFHDGLLLLARGEARPAAEVLRTAVDDALRCGADLLAAQIRVVLALALTQLGAAEAATDELESVVDHARAARLTMLEHSALIARAWLTLRSGDLAHTLTLLRRALALGRAQGYRVVFPWVPTALLQDLALLALQHDIEPDHVRELIRLRGVPPPAADSEVWPWHVRVVTLGRFELLIDDQPFRPGPKAPKKPLELLRALVALGGQGGQGIALGTIEEHLWPDLDGAASRNALNAALHRLRRLLGDEQAIALREGRLSLDANRVWTDCGALRRLAERVGNDELLAPTGQLLSLYRGEFLADDEAPWAIAPRERLRSLFIRIATTTSDRLERVGRMQAAVDLSRQVLEIDPQASDFQRRLMRCQQALERRAEVLP